MHSHNVPGRELAFPGDDAGSGYVIALCMDCAMGLWKGNLNIE